MPHSHLQIFSVLLRASADGTMGDNLGRGSDFSAGTGFSWEKGMLAGIFFVRRGWGGGLKNGTPPETREGEFYSDFMTSTLVKLHSERNSYRLSSSVKRLLGVFHRPSTCGGGRTVR